MADEIRYYYISYSKFSEYMNTFVNKIKGMNKKFDFIFGIPRGGLPIAVHLSHSLKIDLIPCIAELIALRTLNNDINTNILIVDDITDSGETFMNIYNLIKGNLNTTFVSLLIKPRCRFNPDLVLDKVDNDVWVVFPWEFDNISVDKEYMFKVKDRGGK